MSGFNDFASKEIERYLEANKHALKEFCNNQQSAMASACSKVGHNYRTESSTVTPPKDEKSKEESKGSKKKRPPFKHDEPRLSATSEMRSDLDEDTDDWQLEFDDIPNTMVYNVDTNSFTPSHGMSPTQSSFPPIKQPYKSHTSVKSNTGSRIAGMVDRQPATDKDHDEAWKKIFPDNRSKPTYSPAEF
jgi:hypothetical protein